jgi:CubicO group peptidase (beta-lactamase class C family)
MAAESCSIGVRTSILALLASTSALGAQADTARMDGAVKPYADQKRFMGSVLVARGGEVLFSKGYGFANAEWDIPNSPSTKFRLGSLTKQFTAACILILEERGKLKTSDPVKKYLPDAPPAWDKITIYNLLTHTSGIPEFTAQPDYETIKLSPSSPRQTYDRLRDKSLAFQPGERFSYSNSNYLLLGFLIEEISGDSYEKFLQHNVLTPLGLRDTGYDSRALLPRRASGYSRSGGELVNADYIHMSIPQAAGALYSTTEDLLRWEQGLFGGKLLSAASLKKMTTPFKATYACGLGVRTINGHKIISHDGGIEGFETFLAYYPEDRLTVVVLANLNGSTPAARALELASIAHEESGPPIEVR